MNADRSDDSLWKWVILPGLSQCRRAELQIMYTPTSSFLQGFWGSNDVEAWFPRTELRLSGLPSCCHYLLSDFPILPAPHFFFKKKASPRPGWSQTCCTAENDWTPDPFASLFSKCWNYWNMLLFPAILGFISRIDAVDKMFVLP